MKQILDPVPREVVVGKSESFLWASDRPTHLFPLRSQDRQTAGPLPTRWYQGPGLRTPKNTVSSVNFDRLDDLEKWGRKPAPDTVDVSRYAHTLVIVDTDALEGFEAHICASTRVEDVEVVECNSLLSPSILECFAPMGPSLIRLKIGDSETTSRTTISPLARFLFLS